MTCIWIFKNNFQSALHTKKQDMQVLSLCIYVMEGKRWYGKSMVRQTIRKLRQEFSTLRTSLVVQWLRFCAFRAGGTGSIPGRRTKSPHAMWQKKIRELHLESVSIKDRISFPHFFLSLFLSFCFMQHDVTIFSLIFFSYSVYNSTSVSFSVLKKIKYPCIHE